MATLVSEQVRWVADQWENHCGYASAVLSGIVPDKRHKSGYHPSVVDLRRFGVANTDYSNVRPDDRNYNESYGAAIDMSMSPADMRRTHSRVRKVWADKTDPRCRYINAINTWDGSGDAVRLDFYAGTAKYASPDHKWHNHGEIRRRYLLDWTAARAIVSVLKGESKATWLASQKPPAPAPAPKPTPTPAPIVEDDMQQNEKLAYRTDSLERTVGQVLADLANLRNWLVGPVADSRMGAPMPGSPGHMLLTMAQAFPALFSQVKALSDGDFSDEQAIIAGVLAGLSPEAIAAAIPPTVAQQVADELAVRLRG